MRWPWMTRRSHEALLAEHEALINQQQAAIEELHAWLKSWKGRAEEHGRVHSAAVKATKDLLELLQGKGKG